MKRLATFFMLILSVSIGTSPTFGWGNATHAYIAHTLGVPHGTSNLKEMYGSLLPDVFSYMFDENSLYLHSQLHMNPMPFYAAATTDVLKETAFGFLSHNGIWGADYSAHTSAWTASGTGYAVAKGTSMTPLLTPVLAGILVSAGLLVPDAEYIASLMAPELGHDLVEMGVDILVKRSLDPSIGIRMVLAAKSRPATVPKSLAAVYAPAFAQFAGISVAEAAQFLVAAEQEYRVQIMQYGAAFCLPEDQTIALLAEQMAPIAETFIESGLQQNGIALNVTVTAEQVADMIRSAVGFVEGDYQTELEQTLAHLEVELARNTDYSKGPKAQALRKESVASCSLGSNYPNPFNPVTRINYTVGQGEAGIGRGGDGGRSPMVRLTVYDLMGREVAVLVNGPQSTGVHEATFNASNLPSGIYFYKLQADGLTQVKRMTLVK